MKREFHRWYSHRLGMELGVVVYGHWGSPLLGFPTSAGDEWELEGQSLISSLADFIDGGKLKFFTINSINGLSFNNPVDYLSNLSDPWVYGQLASCDIHLSTGTGQWEHSGPTYRLSEILSNKGIRHSLDNWGPMGGHDWPYWKHQMREYISKLF